MRRIVIAVSRLFHSNSHPIGRLANRETPDRVFPLAVEVGRACAFIASVMKKNLGLLE
jgi:hypothetical protein